MKNTRTIKRVTAGMLAAISMISAGSTATLTANASTSTEIGQFINNMNIKEDCLSKSSSSPIEDTIDQGRVEVKYNKDTGKFYKITKIQRQFQNANVDSFSNLGQNNNIIYPGAILLANKDLIDGNPSTVNVSRKDLKLVIDGIATNTGKASVQVNPESYADVTDAINSVVKNWDGSDTRANFCTQSTVAESEEQITTKLGINSSLIKDLKLDFNLDYSRKKSTEVLDMTQIFYTVAIDSVKKGDDAFGSDVTLTDLTDQGVSEDAPPVMVDKVNYGRRIFVKVESSASKTDLDAALQATAFSTTGTVETTYKNILENATYTFVIYGGKTQDIATITSGATFNEFLSSISKTSKFENYSQAAPISYTTRFLKNGKIATATMNTNYIETNVETKDGLKVELKAKDMDHRVYHGNYEIYYKTIKGVDDNGDYIDDEKEYHESYELRDDQSKNLTLPANVDPLSIRIHLSYAGENNKSLSDGGWFAFRNNDGTTKSEIRGFNDINKLYIELEGTGHLFTYTVEGRIKVNDKEVKYMKD